ncbi:MAG: hypothetical protein F4Y01_01270 [Gammaproteobacteria bacterium]|nr:hypothetical protein [Gammaproteobacteria bacterium]
MTSASKGYRDGILSAWQGEQWGREFFELLAAATDDADRRAQWEVLAELERATGDVLLPLVDGDDADAPAQKRPELGTAAAAYGALPHNEALQRMMTLVEPAIERFRELLDMAPKEHREAVQILFDHEVAIRDFAKRELAGDTETSLDPVREVTARARASALAA